MLTTHHSPLTTHHPRGRPGYVLIAVLVVIVVLSLMAYRFTDAMSSEYAAGSRTADLARARAAAASGIHYVAAMLADPDTRRNLIGDPTVDNSGIFRDIAVGTDANNPNKDARFSIISVALVGPGTYEQRYAVTDEGGKLNPNALIAQDKTGEVLFNALMMLPNMTQDIADAIVDWVDADDNPRTTGAENSYYQALGQPYRAKNGALNSLDELLLVKGVTPQLLYGTDRNRNGLGDDDGGSLDRGWADYLTVHGREVNIDSSGVLRIWINNPDDTTLQSIYQALTAAVGQEMAAYIVGYRLFTTAPTRLGPDGNPIPAKGGGKGGGKTGKGGGKQQKVRVGDTSDLIKAVETMLQDGASPRRTLPSVMDMMNTRLTLPQTDSGGSGAFGTGGQQETVVVNSPLNDPNRLNEFLPSLMDKVATKEAVEMVPRLNVNTAPREVLLGLPGLTEADVDAMVGAREGLIPDDPATTSAAWLVTSAGLTPAKFKALERYVTGTTMVYRVEAVGYLAGGGPVARVEAVIDLNTGAPRILYYRELTDLDSPRAFQPQK